MAALVTVGSTRFDALVDVVLTMDCLHAFRERGYTRLIVQYGNSHWTQPAKEWVEEGIHISAFTFKPSLLEDVENAALVISHAGAGTILDVLRAAKPLIVIPNNSLMDDHQTNSPASSPGSKPLDHSCALFRHTHRDLVEAIRSLEVESMTPFPRYDGSRFQTILDEEMGYL
ncbi:glycosyltransferase family 1 protein [Hydnum rufescens UP504]|uniref:UDP-N-acetylglucosamine transferase subunit ALG13 n=1 Tax=Hydnum rufescens UP504 TaxID=1448309 RepID=A0A9P6DR16_9AGAM|nr:glycosyltransferase family 1 protein [Hydnum rufescens UP504]